MITRDDIRELAEFESPEGCALSFFYQPDAPRNQAHREEAILVKDLVRNAMKESEKNGKNGGARADLERILEMADSLRGNNRKGKAVFACSKNNFWREFDLPPRLQTTHLQLNNRFHLRPLTAIADVLPRVSIALFDPKKARFFELWMDEIRELDGFVNELPRRGKSDGFAGYDAGHAERHVANEAMQFFKRIADHLFTLHESGAERFLIGCRPETWPEMESLLHPYVTQRLVGHFSVDPAATAPHEVREHAERLMNEWRNQRRHELVREVVGQTNRNGRGATGVRKVLQSLESGEVQTLLLGRSFAMPGVQCTNCGHLENRITAECAMCGQKTRELDDLADAILRLAVRNRIEIVHVADDPDFDQAQGIAALLRFRADQNTEMKKAV